MKKNLIETALNFIFPQACGFCGEITVSVFLFGIEKGERRMRFPFFSDFYNFFVKK